MATPSPEIAKPGQTLIAILTAAAAGDIPTVSTILDELDRQGTRDVLATLVGAWIGTAVLLARAEGVDDERAYIAEYLVAMGRKAAAK